MRTFTANFILLLLSVLYTFIIILQFAWEYLAVVWLMYNSQTVPLVICVYAIDKHHLWSFFPVPSGCDESRLQLLFVVIAEFLHNGCCSFYQRRRVHLNTVGKDGVSKERYRQWFRFLAFFLECWGGYRD